MRVPHLIALMAISWRGSAGSMGKRGSAAWRSADGMRPAGQRRYGGEMRRAAAREMKVTESPRNRRHHGSPLI